MAKKGYQTIEYKENNKLHVKIKEIEDNNASAIEKAINIVILI